MAASPSGTRFRSKTGKRISSSTPIILGYFFHRSGGGNVWSKNPVPTSYVPTGEPQSQQFTIDETHYRVKSKTAPYQDGGDFLSVKYSDDFAHDGHFGSGSFSGVSNVDRYDGAHGYPYGWEYGTTWFGSLSNNDLLSPSFAEDHGYLPDPADFGTQAWNRAKPQLEAAGGFVFGAELRDLPGMLKTTSAGFRDIWKSVGGNMRSPTMTPKGAADHFLNHQFGWKPFLNDLSKFHSTFIHSDDIIGQLARDNGRRVRRRVKVLEDSNVEVLDRVEMPSDVHWLINRGLPQNMLIGPAVKELSEETYTHVYASGAFTYYRPEFDANKPEFWSAWNRAMRQLTIYGVRVSPANVYKIIPWSWAADWVTNASDYLQYMSDSWLDSIAASYFYLMIHQKTSRVITWTIPYASGTIVLRFPRTIEVKMRTSAGSPFDFGLSWKNLSPRQLTIAGALGISRR